MDTTNINSNATCAYTIFTDVDIRWTDVWNSKLIQINLNKFKKGNGDGSGLG